MLLKFDSQIYRDLRMSQISLRRAFVVRILAKILKIPKYAKFKG
ncbi:hypothetical protein CSUNSWCD_2384 [Campylobacter showae CSUNSWCD]|uniref:Uncharacterized protein n=1 Tax=Campylobacter showae CSUNSWCD TaxID=1244083 RepID=M5IR12_9BACT|nr:hypothetical protein CSUNSWCD_2384 [Campylobacter showae CSUNSWCD]